MFWGLVLEAGKRYSQIVSSSFHISMACLKGLDALVDVVFLYNKIEYTVCSLSSMKHGMYPAQQFLNLNLTEGEEIEMFIRDSHPNANFNGCVYLSGYCLTDTPNWTNSEVRTSKRLQMNGVGAESDFTSKSKKRSLNQIQNGGDGGEDSAEERDGDSSMAAGPSKVCRTEPEGGATISDLLAASGTAGVTEDDDDDEDFEASALVEGSSEEEDDDSAADEDEDDDEDDDLDEPDEDELAGLQEDMNVSISTLKASIGGTNQHDFTSFAKNTESPDAISIKKETKEDTAGSGRSKEAKKKKKTQKD